MWGTGLAQFRRSRDSRRTYQQPASTKVNYEEGRTEPVTDVCSWRMRDCSHKLKKGRFRLDIRKKSLL